jgi:hypothetical protein
LEPGQCVKFWTHSWFPLNILQPLWP